MRPGLRAATTGELSRFSYRAEVSAEPYRRNAPRYRANLTLGTALGPGALGLEFGAGQRFRRPAAALTQLIRVQVLTVRDV